jgi:hypothetical protein
MVVRGPYWKLGKGEDWKKLFSEPVLKKGIHILKDTQYTLQRSTKAPVNVCPNTNTRTFQEVGNVCI